MTSREEYLARLSRRLVDMGNDRLLDNHKNQLRSKDLLTKLSSPAVARIDYTYDVDRVVRNGTFLLEAASRLLDAGQDSTHFARELLLGAEIFEHLGSLGEGPDQAVSLLMSAGLYQLAGYQANALCLARMASLPDLSGDVIPEPSDLLRRWTTMAFRRNFLALRRESAYMLERIAEFEERFLATIAQGGHHPDNWLWVAQIALAAEVFRDFSRFALAGADLGERPRSELSELLQTSGQALEFLLFGLFKSFEATLAANSTWTILRDLIQLDATWSRYLTLLARGRAQDPLAARGAVELWKSQQTALAAGLLGEGAPSFVVRMPTSSGKTRIAELAIMRHLTGVPPRRAVYVAPYRALAAEIEGSFQDLFSDLGFSVASVLGSFEVDEFEQYLLYSTDLLIVTPEKLTRIARSEPNFFDNVGILILDEGHVIDDRERGAKYELLVTRLRQRLAPATQLLFISAVLSEQNAEDFGEWLCDDRQAVISTDWRPTRQTLGILRWSNTGAQIDFPFEPPFAGTQAPFVPRVLQAKAYTDFTPKLRKERQVVFPSATKGDLSADLAIVYASLGPVLVFTTRPDWVESTARAVLKGLRLRRQTDGVDYPSEFQRAADRATQTSSYESVVAWLGEDSLVAELIRNGIGVHHGGLPEHVRRAVEQDFRNGLFPVLVATSTLAQGVNLPIKTVIVHTATRFEEADFEDDEGHPVTISQRDFWNICGRAGRAGAETEGQIIFISLSARDQRTFSDYATRAYEPIQGRLFELLGALTAGRLSQTEFGYQLDSDILAMLLEEAPDLGDLERLIGGSFAAVQARRAQVSLDPLVATSLSVARSLLDRVPDAERRNVFARTGLSATSCEQLAEWILSEHAAWLDALTNPGTGLLDFVSLLFDAVSQLPEMEPRYSFATDHRQLLADWVTQTPIELLKQDHCLTKADEQLLVRFVEDYFAYRLPWGMSSAIQIARSVLGLDALSDMPRWVPAMVKYGVNSPRACWAMSVGAPTRKLAAEIATAYVTDSADQSFPSFLGWFGQLTEEDFVFRLGATEHQAVSLVRRARGVPGSRQGGQAQLDFPVFSKVRGLQYEGRSGSLESAQPGDAVSLEREYANQYDPNAVEVVLQGNQIGYLERGIARILAPMIDVGDSLRGNIAEVTRTPHLEVTVAIERQ